MGQPTARFLNNQYAQGVPMRILCARHGLKTAELRALLGKPPIGKRGSKKDRKREQAIAELKAEGYSDEQIRAVFGK